MWLLRPPAQGFLFVLARLPRLGLVHGLHSLPQDLAPLRPIGPLRVLLPRVQVHLKAVPALPALGLSIPLEPGVPVPRAPAARVLADSARGCPRRIRAPQRLSPASLFTPASPLLAPVR